MAVMKLQSEHRWCGACAAVNALLAIGIERSEVEIASLAKTSAWDGTGSRGIIEALKKVGVTPAVVHESREDIAALRFDKALSEGRPIVLAVGTDEPWDHWVAVIGQLGGYVTVADPAAGTLNRPFSEVMQWARGPKNVKKPFYGIVIL